MRALFRVGVAVYVYSGEVRREGILHGADVDEQRHLTVDVSSEGNAHVRLLGSWAVWPAADYPGPEATSEVDLAVAPEPPMLAHGALPEGPVLPQTRRLLVTRQF